MELVVDGRKAYAYTGGKPFDPALPCIVFVHGALHDHSVWTLLARWCAHHGHSVLAVDLPGHGRSDWREDGDYGPKLNAQTLRPVLRELAPHPRLVVGMSLGGLTALRLATTEPAPVP